MSGDYSRKTFKREKHYSGVRMQQGRVQLDADWNEEHDIQNYRTETEAIDVIGQCGAPMENGGFKIGDAPGGHDLTISAGRIYVEGLLLELEQPSTYTTQPHFPNPDETTASSPPAGSPPGSALELDLDPGIYLAYLDAWQREITPLDDKLIREVALGGPDTAARIQNVWQLKLLRVAGEISASGDPPSPQPTCGSAFPEFDALTAPSTGMLNARTQPPGGDDNPCLLPPSAGYRRLENQLYRVEMQTGGTRDEATFKFSRDNASVETKITNINDDVLTVADTGKDEVLNFAGGQWVEIVDDESTLKGTPHPLVQIDKIEADQITLKSSVASLANRPGLKLRRWDQAGTDATADGIPANLSNWINLEGGIQIEFAAGEYHAGDYWLIPARTVTGEIEWPPYEIPNINPLAQPPGGIRHHYCRLALVEVASTGLAKVIDDCRNLFPPLTKLTHFFYVGGAGQEAMPDQRLPCPLRVGVTNGQFPVAGAPVRFTVANEVVGTLHAGTSSGQTLLVETDADGIALCELELRDLRANLRVGRRRLPNCLEVVAELVNPAGGFFEPPIHFNFNLSIAGQVAYNPNACPDLAEAGAFTVQAAIDHLCRQKPEREPGIKIKEIQTLMDEQQLLNDGVAPVSRLSKGLIIICDSPISSASGGRSPEPPPPRFPRSIAGKPTCFVTLDLPYPLGADRNFWDMPNEIVGYQPLILGGNVSIKETQMLWTPTSETNSWLQNILFQRLQQTTDRVLAHLTLKGNFIFSPDAKLYLDGEAFGRAKEDERIELVFPTGAERKGGDFEMWFWLMSSNTVTGINLSVTTSLGAAGGIVSGSVRDTTNAVLAQVPVSLTELSSGQTKTIGTDDNGGFGFGGLRRGDYKVSVVVNGITSEQTVTVGA
jgi:hypothetical protein